MSDVKQVKVDNWGIFFLQRLKHFFNRTDYCDLTLQFQDNARLKVHRLVLSACTDYFELLERTCEMYEDCLIMPDDLQADVVVPIVNFMYTGQLEFRMDLLEKLYQTSLVMNMPVLTKLLDAHRNQPNLEAPSLNYNATPKRYAKTYDTSKQYSTASSSSANQSNKRSYTSAFDNNSFRKYKKPPSKNESDSPAMGHTESPTNVQTSSSKKQQSLTDPRPTRYELPDELDSDNLFSNSFTSISYTSKPLMVHPETTKRYPAKRSGIFEDPSTSQYIQGVQGTMDIVDCKKVVANDSIFDDESENINNDHDHYSQSMSMSIKAEPRDANQLFDQILESDGPKVTIETKDNKQANNLDHAKIISEVLKKYPHLVKSNKNIKLKILNTSNKKKSTTTIPLNIEKEVKKPKPDFAFETEVIDSKEAAKLIALGAENVKGPWICLICGTPGKAIHFTSYYKFRRHLVDVHNEKPVSNICEYCGLKSLKRNYLLHHLYTKHGIEPPPQYHFPKCNLCNYVALTEGFLVKHKLTHADNKAFRCNVCSATFTTSHALLGHIRKTGHKYSADRKIDLQCIYCLKVFLREANLYAHLKTLHKEIAKNDGIIDISDDESQEKNTKMKSSPNKPESLKYEVPVTYDNEYEESDIQYQIQQQPDGNIEVISKKPRVMLPVIKHKILNSGFGTSSTKQQTTVNSKTTRTMPTKQSESVQDEFSITNSNDEIIMIDNREFIVKENQLIPKKEKVLRHEEYVCYEKSDVVSSGMDESIQNINPAAVEFTSIHPSAHQDEQRMIIKKTSNINQPIQIVVSNEEEYKALMASNHSIIFEDGDANKTLTVLTTPHTALNTTNIDLETSQSNDMMIIQDDYPIHVSEATMATDNSNIVVVYSHRLNDPNKPYQVITSQNLGEQYVSSSGILTQNYETVTTSASVMNTHVIETPVQETWQNNNPQNITAAEITVPITGQQIVTSVESQHRLNNLAEVQVATSHSVPMEINQTDEHNVNQTTITHPVAQQLITTLTEDDTIVSDIQVDDAKTSEIVPVFVETMHTIATSNTNMDLPEVNDEVRDQMDQTSENINHKEIHETGKYSETLIVNEVPQSGAQHKNIDETGEMQGIGSHEDIETIENISKDIEHSDPRFTEQQNIVSMEVQTETSAIHDTINNGEVSLTKAKNPIESLTSEWSEDELETMGQEPSNLSDKTLKDNNLDNADTDSQPELEESIENIQQEMAKQMARAIEVTVPHPGNVKESESAVDIVAPSGSKKATEKISSLLNDWEDHDSQGDSVSNIEEESIESEQQNETAHKKIAMTAELSKTDIKAEEKIKKLVSDWEEEEETEEPENKSA